MDTALIILAAGKGTRMQSDLPKVLHPIAGAPMLIHAMKAGAAADPARTVVVAGHGADLVRAAAHDWDPDCTVVEQTAQLGTGHAVAQATPALTDFSGDAIVLYGDTPFIAPQTLAAMTAARQYADVVVLGFQAADPGRYGRLIKSGDALDRIVEAKDATDEELSVTLCNSGVVAADAQMLASLVAAVDNDNASGEYYLTDIVGLARARGLRATVVECDEAETLGVNSRAELVRAEQIFQANARKALLEDGVIMPAPDTVHLSFDTVIGRDAMIEPYVVFAPGVTVETGATIRAFSHLEGCHVSRDAIIGPYARLRPGAEISEAAKIGNFVEVKSAQIGEGAKVNHLSYIGNAQIGARSNVGAGTVTCNYDGYFKHQTAIGEDVFVGSNTMLVAPVTVGDGALTASGSVITSDVPPGDLALGRAKQVNKPGLATKLMDHLKALKEKRAKGTS